MRAITGDEGGLALACSTMSDTQSSVTRVVMMSSSSLYVSLKLAGLSVSSRSKSVAAFACRSAYVTTPPGRLAAHFVQHHRKLSFWSVIRAEILTAASCPATTAGPATARGHSEACAAPTTCTAAAAASAAVSASVAGTSSVDAAPATGAAASAVGAAASTTTGAVPATCTCAGATDAAAAASLLRRCCFSRLRL